MSSLRVAVIGSIDPSRAYVPALRDVAVARRAAEEMGRELAAAGHRLIVTSQATTSVDSFVMRGYTANTDRPGETGPTDFDLDTTQGALDPSVGLSIDDARREAVLLRRVRNADCLVLIGGGRITRSAGFMGAVNGQYVVALSVFGGSSATVRSNLRNLNPNVTDDEVAQMGRPWTADSARVIVHGMLTRQRMLATRAKASARKHWRSRLRIGVGMVLGLLCLLSAFLAIPFTGSGSGKSNMLLLLGAPLIAAVGGAIARDSYNATPQILRTTLRGLLAGMVSVFLWFSSQAFAIDNSLDHLNVLRLMVLSVPLGCAAGFTFEHVLEKVKVAHLPDVSWTKAETVSPDDD